MIFVSRLIFLLSLALLPAAHAHLPPTDEQLAELQATGKLSESEAFAGQLEDSSFSQGIVARAQYKLQVAGMKAQGYTEAEIKQLLPSPAPPPDRRNLPTTGTPKTLTLLVDFADYRAATEHPNISRPASIITSTDPALSFPATTANPMTVSPTTGTARRREN